MQVQDRRVKRTQRLLAQALIELILDKGFDTITIRDITERADVGYATFFRHYPDKEALLHDVLNVVLDELTNLLHLLPSDDPQQVGTLLFQYVQDHSAIVQVFLRSGTSSSLYQHILQVGTQNVLQEQTPMPDSQIPKEIAAYHIVTASINLIGWWLDHNIPYSLERMGIIYKELIVEPTQRVAFQP